MHEQVSDSFKFAPPEPPFGFMDRPRLLESVARGLGGRLILLLAPAGHGKTSLLASLAARWTGLNGHPPEAKLAWYQLDPRDGDPAVFLEGIVGAIRKVVPRFGRTTMAAIHSTADVRAEFGRLLGVLQEELRSAGERTLFLVLDDFHAVTDLIVLQALEEMLKDPGSPLRLVVGTEVEPRFYLAHFRANGTLRELGAEDFLFTSGEIKELVSTRTGNQIDQSVVDNLMRETGGWPSAAVLAAAIVARTGRPLPFNRLAPTEHGYAQLVRKVIADSPPDLRMPLLRSSLLRIVDAEMAGFLGGIAAWKSILRLAEVSPLPAMQLSGSRVALTYDSLFASGLRRELAAALPGRELKELEKQVGSEYAARGDWEEAARCYVQAEAYEDLATLVETVAERETDRGHLDTVLRWLRAIPSSVRKGRPRLMVHEARTLLARGKVDEARVLLVTVEPALRAAGDQTALGWRTSSWARVHLLEGRYRDAQKIAEDALALIPREDAAERAEVCLVLARALETQGELPAAFSAASEGLLLAEESSRQPLVVRALTQLAEIAELRGACSQTLALAGRAVERSASLGMEESVIAGAGGLAVSAYLERDQPEEAAAVAAATQDAAGKLRDAAGEIRAHLGLLRVGLASDPPRYPDDTAEALLGQAATLSAHSHEGALVLQTLASASLRRGDKKEALRLARLALASAQKAAHQPLIQQCQMLVAAAEPGGPGSMGSIIRMRQVRDALIVSDSRRWVSGALRLMAEAYARAGLGWRARANLQKSLLLAADEGWIGMPLRIPSRAAQLFVLAVRHGLAVEVAGTLLGVGPAWGARLLAPMLMHQKPEVRERAQRAIKGLEAGLGRVPHPRVVWPGVVDGSGDGQPVDLQTLGDVRVFVAGENPRWPTPDARNLAAYFVVNRARAVPRGGLLRDLWPNTNPAEANVRLQVAMYQLRETLGREYPRVDPELEEGGQYLWDGTGCGIDVERFRDLTGEAERLLADERPPVLGSSAIGVLEEAVGIYQGEFLSDLDFEWCGEQREELRGRLLRATRLLMDHYMALRDWRHAIPHGVKSLKSDPLQEDVVRDLMVCYFRIGDRGAVVRQYRELKRLLARERGEWPAEETRKVRIRLLGK